MDWNKKPKWKWETDKGKSERERKSKKFILFRKLNDTSQSGPTARQQLDSTVYVSISNKREKCVEHQQRSTCT